MVLRWLLRPNAYHDSVKLMRISEELVHQPGIHRAAAVMATPLNIELLADDGLLPNVQATPQDLLVVVAGESDDAAAAALGILEELLAARVPHEGQEIRVPKRTVEGAVTRGANLAVIAVPGEFAATEAFAALHAGMDVFLFSDNVSLEDEICLKRLAEDRGLLLMGPDCGTAILGGVGLGFANRVEHGPIGIVGASGTGIQQLSCLLDASGIGIAHAIGTGGRDLSAAVGASMTRRVLPLLEADDAVEAIALVSKPGDDATILQLHDQLCRLSKPAVACFLGPTPPDAGSVRYAVTLSDAADMLAKLCGSESFQEETESVTGATHSGPGAHVYGLFAGGTLCSEAGRTLNAMGVPHTLVDLGRDEYTRGRAHPIIDPRLRVSMLEETISKEGVGAIMLDIILGDLAHGDPVTALLPALERARSRSIPVIAVLVGTLRDPQGLARQRTMLADAGATVFASNARAASTAGTLVRAR